MNPMTRSSQGQPSLSVSVLSRNDEHTFAEDPHGAFVHRHHCYAGLSDRMLTQLAKGFGLPVFGGTDQANPILGYNRGMCACGTPDGKYRKHLARPR